MNKVLALLFLLFSFNAMAFSEPDNSGCVEEVTEIDSYFTACSGEDKFAKIINVYEHKTFDKIDDIAQDGDYTDEEKDAIVKNQEKLQNDSSLSLQVKGRLFDIIFDSDILIVSCFLIMLVFLLRNVFGAQEISKRKNIMRATFLMLIIVFFANSNKVESNLAQLTMYTGNAFTRWSISAMTEFYKEEDKVVREKLEDSSEAMHDLKAFYEFSACVINEEKHTLMKEDTRSFVYSLFMSDLESLQDRNNRRFETKASHLEGNQRISLVSRQEMRFPTKDSKVSNFYQTDTPRTVEHTGGCGEIKFRTVELSNEEEIMAGNAGFVEALKKAVTENNLKAGWSSFKNAFVEEYGEAKNRVETYQNLLKAFIIEYKKAQIIGLTLFENTTDEKGYYTRKINFQDNSNLERNFNSALTFYKNINEELCLRDKSKVIASKEILASYESDPEEKITDWDCLNMDSDGNLSVAATLEYDIKKESEDIKVESESLRRESKLFFQDESKRIQEAYDESRILFIEEMIEFDKEYGRNLEQYVNEGFLSFSKALKEVRKGNSNQYFNFKELSNSIAVLPLRNGVYQVSKEVESNLEMYTTDVVEKHFPEITELERPFAEEIVNLSSDVDEDTTRDEDSSSIFGDVSDDLRTGLSGITCSRPEGVKCISTLKDYDSNYEFDKASKSLIESGMYLTTSGFVGEFVTGVAKTKLNTSKKENSVGKAVVSASVGALNWFADKMVLVGMAMVVVGTMLTLINDLTDLVSISIVFNMIISFKIMPLLVLMSAINSLQSSITENMFSKSIGKIFDIMYMPFYLMLMLVFVILGTHFSVIIAKTILPWLNSLTMEVIAVESDNLFYILLSTLMSSFVMFTVLAISVRMYIAMFKNLADLKAFTDSADRGLESIKNTAKIGVIMKTGSNFWRQISRGDKVASKGRR